LAPGFEFFRHKANLLSTSYLIILLSGHGSDAAFKRSRSEKPKTMTSMRRIPLTTLSRLTIIVHTAFILTGSIIVMGRKYWRDLTTWL